MATDTWFNDRNQPIKTRQPGGLVTKMVYDGAGRIIKQSASDGGGDATWTAANNVIGDMVLDQTLTSYDADGNVIFTVHKERDHDTTATGELTKDNARVSTAANYYDVANRLTTSINFGNNGDDSEAFHGTGDAYTRPTLTNYARGVDTGNSDPNATNGFDRWLRTDQAYDVNGRAAMSTDPRGIQSRTYYDSLGRPIAVVDAYTGGIDRISPADDTAPGFDTDRKTTYVYNSLDQKTSETSITYNAAAPSSPRSQTTSYFYGVTKSGGSYVNNNSLPNKITYGLIADDPNENLPAVVGLTSDEATFDSYNALGQLLLGTDRNGAEHAYTFDTLGRQTSDKSTSMASFSEPFVSTWADEKRTGYDALGRGVTFTMLSGGSVVNQVKRVFDGLGNLVTEYQEHSGAVNTSSSKKVQYAYDTSFTNNRTRLTSVTYPDGHAVSYEYGYFGVLGGATASVLGTLNNTISRVGAVDDTATPSAANRLETYDYLGVNTVVDRELRNLKKNATTNLAVGLSYLHDDVLNNEVPDDGGTSDPYDGLDRFGRVVYQNWYNLGDRRVLAYDADSNLLYSKVPFPNITNKWRSEIYHLQGAMAFDAYDRLNRAKAFIRGVMQTGDRTVSQDPIQASPGVFVDTQYTSQTFSTSSTSSDFKTTAQLNAEAVNKGQVFQKSRPSTDVYFDLGATLTDTKRRDTFLTYDAWGSLSAASFASLTGSDTTYQYTRTFDNNFEYDALGRRIKEQETHRDGKVEQTEIYYDIAGHDIQDVHKFVTDNQIPDEIARYVYGAAAGGAMILRDDKDTSGTARRTWVMQAGDGSTQALYVQASGGSQFVERLSYTPQGLTTFLSPNVSSATGYIFTDGGSLDWRFTWKGGRTVRDQDRSIYGNQTDASIVDRQSGLLFLGGGTGPAYDSTGGTPLLEDKYAFFRVGGYPNDGTAIDSHKFSARGSVNTQFMHNGSGPTWSDTFLSALSKDPTMRGFGAIAGELDWVGNFTSAFVSDVSRTVVGALKEIGSRAVDFANNYAFFMSGGLVDFGRPGMIQLSQAQMNGASVARATFSSVPLVGSGYNVIMGEDLLTGRELHGVDRVAAGFAFASDLAFAGAGGVAWRDAGYPLPRFMRRTADAVVSEVGVTQSATIGERIEGVAQRGFNYAVENPRRLELSRMQLGKDAEIQATRWLRRWAERNDVPLGQGGLRFQVRGANSVPDVVFDPTRQIFDFKLSPASLRPTQTRNIIGDFPNYDLRYIYGPDLWR